MWVVQAILSQLDLKFLYFYIFVALLFFGYAIYGPIKHIIRIIRQKYILRKVPGPGGLPLIGVSHELLNKDTKEIYWKMSQKYCTYEGGVSKAWIAHVPYVFVYTPETAEPVLSSKVHINKAAEYRYFHDWLGQGLLTSGGSLWQYRRKLLTPAFHFQMLENYTKAFNNQSKKLIEILHRIKKEPKVDIIPRIVSCTLDTIMEAAMGVPLNAQEGDGVQYIDALQREAAYIQQRLGRAYLKSDLCAKALKFDKFHQEWVQVLHERSLGAIQDRTTKFLSSNQKETNGSNGKVRLSFLDLLLKKFIIDGDLSRDDVREEVDTFMFEGHDTTASGLSFCVFALGCHPEHQKKIQEELDDIFGDSDRMPTMEDLKNMNYLECCFKEAMRLFPPVPFVGRMLEEDTQIGGHLIPKGSTMYINFRKIHRDPAHFPDPDTFDPDRFLPENCKNRHPYAFVPFSAGPRNCIGQKFALMEAKTILSSIFRYFNVESVAKMEDVKVVAELVMRPINDRLEVRLTERT